MIFGPWKICKIYRSQMVENKFRGSYEVYLSIRAGPEQNSNGPGRAEEKNWRAGPGRLKKKVPTGRAGPSIV